jgi:hypothetical protein
MKLPFALLALASVAVARAQSTPVPDPVRDYLANFDVRRGEEIITATADINGDGTPDMFVTRNTLSNGRQGNLWVVYESVPGGFRRIDEQSDGAPIEFHRKAVSFRPRKDGKGLELVRYSPGGAGEGVLAALVIGEGTARETVTEEGFRPGSEEARYASLFEDESTRPVFVAEASDVLLRKHFPMGRWFLHMTPLKWAIASVAGLAGLVVLLAVLRILLPAGRSQVRR